MWYLNTLSKGDHAIIDRVEELTLADPISARLGELGFVPGERVEIVATGPIGAEQYALLLLCGAQNGTCQD